MANLIQIAQKYIDCGYWVVPTKNNKTPDIATWGEKPIMSSVFSDCYGIGIICGLSKNIEIIDIDNHFGDAQKLYCEFTSIKEVNEILDKYKLPIQSTQGGGYHIIFRCSFNEGSRKLAWRWNEEKKAPEATFETKGIKGYFIIDPTPGYIILCNDIFNIPVISQAERDILISNAISFNEFIEPSKKKTTEFEKRSQTENDRPGDIYNNNSDSLFEAKTLLIDSGWQETVNNKWRRPGKKEGVSAGFIGDNLFYVFSSNAYPFEPMKAYTPFQILALLKYNGNFSDAAKSLLPEKSQSRNEQKPEITIDEIEKILLSSRINTSIKVEKPPVILSKREFIDQRPVLKRMFTLGNFSCIIGKAKTKKTYLISFLTAILLKNEYDSNFHSEIPKEKKLILYFDTEQGEYDSYNVIKRIEDMAQRNENFKGFMLRPFTPLQRCEIIEHAFKLWGDSCCLCVIDGVADLANAINDEVEASRVTTMFLRLTKTHNCHITTVIHQNKNDNFATGHLGSSIMKKAELLISVSKNSEQKYISDINCDLSRGIDFEQFSIKINENGFPEYLEGEQSKNYINHYEKNEPDF